MYFVIFALSLTFLFFFFNDTATTEIYTLSLHDALPIFASAALLNALGQHVIVSGVILTAGSNAVSIQNGDRKSTRLNSSHTVISYAVFCLKKKKKKRKYTTDNQILNHIITQRLM